MHLHTLIPDDCFPHHLLPFARGSSTINPERLGLMDSRQSAFGDAYGKIRHMHRGCGIHEVGKAKFLRSTVDAAQLQRSTYSIKDEVVVQFIDVILFAGKGRHAARQAV